MSVERRRSELLLRQVDWRFLLRQPQKPAALDLTGGEQAEALRLVADQAVESAGGADLVVTGFPSARSLARAREALRPGGELACGWRWPGGLRRARRRLRRAGFSGIGLYRPWPASGVPQLWLPADAPRIARQALAERPARSRREALQRWAWRHFGPVHAIAQLPETTGATDPPSELPNPDAWVLLTGGPEADAKVVGLPMPSDGSRPGVIVKFARIAKAEVALEREAEHLRALEQQRPTLPGVPRLRGTGRRAGQLATVQDAIHGQPLNVKPGAAGLAEAARPVTEWLAALAGSPPSQPAAAWRERLVVEPLAELERALAGTPSAGLPGGAREGLTELGDLPLVWEHRDFGPWNVVDANGGPAAIDWEDAEPQGLPGLDLAYFLASAAFDAEPQGEASWLEHARRVNARLHDPSTELGAVGAACVAEYCAAVGIAAQELPRLRLLCWIVQSTIACRRLPPGASGPTAGSDAELFVRLAEDELQALQNRP